MWHIRRLLLVGREEFVLKVARTCFRTWFPRCPQGWEGCVCPLSGNRWAGLRVAAGFTGIHQLTRAARPGDGGKGENIAVLSERQTRLDPTRDHIPPRKANPAFRGRL